ncbi:MAG: primosomal protein N' [Bacteroidota bacterium]|nr:primosomal protein N' [Bacteroidota bacterium]
MYIPNSFADVAVPVVADKLFTYIIPVHLQHIVRAGIRVLVPFGQRTIIGFVVDVKDQSEKIDLKSILDVIDPEPIIPEDLLKLTQWISDYYIAPRGKVLKSAIIHNTFKTSKRIVKLNIQDFDSVVVNKKLTPKQKIIIEELKKRKPLSIQQLQKRLNINSIYSTLNSLTQLGIIKIDEESIQHGITAKYEAGIMLDDKSRKALQTWLKELMFRPSKRYGKQVTFIQHLLRYDDKETFISIPDILKKTKASLSTIRSLEKNKIITIGKREVIRSQEYEIYKSALGSTDITLNNYQKDALQKIINKVQQSIFHTFLLYGVTGSGKTQVYIETITETIKHGKSAIVLVPEISLTPQIVRRFKFHLGDNVTVVHSRMSAGERQDAWRRAWEGKISVVIGPRSAVFAPLKNLGLIVVDEEHEASYKQFDQTPRYHARDAAIMRASYCNAVVVLGSATPSIESFTNALNNKYTLLELPERVDNAKLPDIHLVDMTEERGRKLQKHRDRRKEELKKDPMKAKFKKQKFEIGSISDLLREKIEDRLKKKEGIILLQNRRGFSPFVECPNCGYVETCDNCTISLTYHGTTKLLRCHYCGSVKQTSIFCPNCQSLDIQYRGFGTQRVEEELLKLFRGLRLLRMDLDTTSTRGAHDKLLKKFSDGEADILLGTQMVAKGLDFSRVTLVGVISADTQMLLPDFRSAERTFQLLTQVAGRAGRSNLAGEVIIQTYQPKHQSLQHVLKHEFKSFYEDEIAFRKELNYPPFSRLILIEFKGKQENDVIKNSSKFAELLKKYTKYFITLGPAAAAITKLKGQHRWHIIVKSLKTVDPAGKFVHKAIQQAIQDYQKSTVGKSKSVKMIIDVDPVGMM